MITERMTSDTFRQLFHDVLRHGFVCMQTSQPQEAYRYLTDNLSIRFTWHDRPLPEMEVKFAKDALDDYQLTHRVKLAMTGLDVWFSDINTNIAFKETLLKSPKDMEDARHLRITYREFIDEEKIKNIKRIIQELRL
jgi:hypothetical protein